MLLYDVPMSKDIYASRKYEHFDIRSFGQRICHLIMSKYLDFQKHIFILSFLYFKLPKAVCAKIQRRYVSCLGDCICIYENHCNNWNQPLLAPLQLQLYADPSFPKRFPFDSSVG